MFFIGVFGIQSKAKTIKTEQGVICPVCGSYDRYDVLQTFNYFNIFFIPIWRWNKRYFLKTRCCQQTCELQQEIGKRIEKGEEVEITQDHLDCGQLPYRRICPNCQAKLEGTF